MSSSSVKGTSTGTGTPWLNETSCCGQEIVFLHPYYTILLLLPVLVLPDDSDSQVDADGHSDILPPKSLLHHGLFAV